MRKQNSCKGAGIRKKKRVRARKKRGIEKHRNGGERVKEREGDRRAIDGLTLRGSYVPLRSGKPHD